MRTTRLALATILLTCACSSIGPRTIPRDRFDYGEAIADSWKETLLLNIVKLRYLDLPMFVDVSSIINQYSLEGDVQLGAAWSSGVDTLWSGGGSGKFYDRPTITYTPITGKEFTRSLLTPVSPGAVLFLVQAGWPVELLFRTCVQATNGIYNRGGSAAMGLVEPDEGFDELVDGLVAIQASGAIGLRVEGLDHGEAALLVIRRHADERVTSASLRVRELLGLQPDAEAFRVTYGADAEDGQNIALLTRSVFEILLELGKQIDVPEDAALEQRTVPGMPSEAGPSRLVRIHTGKSPPPKGEVYVQARYRDDWYWIDDRDIFSKRTFAFVQVLLNLTKDDSKGAVPLLSVGA